MSSMTKKRNKRWGRKRALKWVSSAMRDSMQAAKRSWGQGKPK